MGQWGSTDAHAREREEEKKKYIHHLRSGDTAYGIFNEFHEAINCYEKALETAKKSKDKKQETLAFLKLGDLYESNNRSQKAIECFKNVRKIAKECKDKQDETLAFLKLGDLYESNNRSQKAIECFNKVFEIAKQVTDLQLRALACSKLGHVYQSNNQFQKAVEYFQQNFEIAERRHDKQEKAKARLMLGDAYKSNNQIQKAVECFEKALEIDEQTRLWFFTLKFDYMLQTAIAGYVTTLENSRNLLKKANTNILLGLAFISSNHFQPAVEYFQKALNIGIKDKDKWQEREAYLWLGHAYRSNNKFSTAIEYYEKALKIAKEQEEKPREAEAYLWLGYTYSSVNDLQTAVEYHEKALNSSNARGDKQQEKRAYLGLGDAYRLNDQAQLAIENYEKTLKIPNEREDKRQKTAANLFLGSNFLLPDNPVEMLIEKCVLSEIVRNQEDMLMEIKIFLDLGDAYDQCKQKQKALEYWESALKLADKLGFQRYKRRAIRRLKKFNNLGSGVDLKAFSTNIDAVITARQLLYVGHSFQSEGRNEEAIKSYEQAVQIVGKMNRSDIEVEAYQHLGNVYSAIQTYEKAIEYYKMAHELSPDLEPDEMEVVAYQWLGYNHFQDGQYQKSMEFWNEVIKLSSSFGYKERKMNAYIGLGSAARNTGDVESSLGYFSKALTIAEQLNDKGSQRVVHTNFAQVYYNFCEFEAAAESYLKVQELSHNLGEGKEESDAHLMLGNSFQQLKQPEKAIESYQEALTISIYLDDEETQAEAVQRLAFVLLSFDQCKEAQTYLKMLVQLTGKLNHSGMEQVLNHKRLGMCHFTLESVEESLACFMKALEIIRNLSNKAQEAIINEWCGYCNRFIPGRNKEALEFYESAKRISKEVGEKYQEYRTNQAIGNILANIGDYEKAKQYYDEAIKVATELNDRYREGTSFLNFAWVCHKSYNDNVAIEWYKKVLIVSKELNDHLLQEKALIGQGIAWFYRGNAQQAIDLLREARNANEEEPGLDEQIELTDEQLIEEASNPSRTERLSSVKLDRLEKHIEQFSSCSLYSPKISVNEPFTEKVRKSMTEIVKTSAFAALFGRSDQDKVGSGVGKFANVDQEIYNFARKEVFKNASTRKPAKLNKRLVKYDKSIGQVSCGSSVQGTCFLVTNELVITNYHVYRMIMEERKRYGNLSLPIIILFDYLDHGEREKIIKVEVDEEQDSKFESPYLDYKFFHLKQNEGLQGRVPLGPMVRNFQLADGRVVILGHPGGNEMQEEVCIVVGYSSYLKRIRERHEQCTGVHMTNAELLDKTENYRDCLPYDSSFFKGASGSPVFDMNGNIVAMHAQGYTLETTETNILNQEQENVPSLVEENVASREEENVPIGVEENVANLVQEDAANRAQEIGPNLVHENSASRSEENVASLAQENAPNLVEENGANLVQENVGNMGEENFPNLVQEGTANLADENDLNFAQENVSRERTTVKYSLMEFGVQFVLICEDMTRRHGEYVVSKIFPNHKLKECETWMDLT